MQGHPSGVLLRTIVISLTAFLTVVDLFAIQAILPCLARAYKVMPAMVILRYPGKIRFDIRQTMRPKLARFRGRSGR